MITAERIAAALDGTTWKSEERDNIAIWVRMRGASRNGIMPGLDGLLCVWSTTAWLIGDKVSMDEVRTMVAQAGTQGFPADPFERWTLLTPVAGTPAAHTAATPKACRHCGMTYRLCTDALLADRGPCCRGCKTTATHDQHAWESAYGMLRTQSMPEHLLAALLAQEELDENPVTT